VGWLVVFADLFLALRWQVSLATRIVGAYAAIKIIDGAWFLVSARRFEKKIGKSMPSPLDYRMEERKSDCSCRILSGPGLVLIA
jgi:hypothetical protein